MTAPILPIKDGLLMTVYKCCLIEIKSHDAIINELLDQGDEFAADIGTLTDRVAKHSGLSVDETRVQLTKLHVSGKIVRNRNTGDVARWWPIGLAKELRDANKALIISTKTDAN